MTKTIRLHRHGGPEVLTIENVPLSTPVNGQVCVRHTAIGLNFIDTYHRSGLYPVPLPSGIGLEAAGVVEAVGPNVENFRIGDRVCYGTGPIGAYAEARVMPTSSLLRIPDGIDDHQAAAMMLKGMTAEYLIKRTFVVCAGMTVLVHAAAGGVGLILCQWLKDLGATVIGTVSSDAKAILAVAHGCDHPIVYGREDFIARVRDLTNGEGVPVVYDGVGKDTFNGSLDCLARRGMMVSYGNASGAVAPIDPLVLSAKGALFLTRPTLMSYNATRIELEQSAQALFDVVLRGAVSIAVKQTYSLDDAAQAHSDLESRKTTGSSVLIP